VRPRVPCADSPHHITSIFAPMINESLELTGSIGAGIAVEPRLRLCLASGSPTSISTISRVARLIGLGNPPSVELSAPLPPGSGYAVSAASAITSALVLGSQRLSVNESLRIAHYAEILEGTGLGDVLAISCGVGIVVRVKAGAPGVGEVNCKQVPGSVALLSIETGRMHTSVMLSRLGEDFSNLAFKYLNKIIEDLSIESFAYYSQRFSLESGLLKQALGNREPPRVPGLIGMYGKKKVIVFLVERDRVEDAVNYLERWGASPRLLEASRGPPRLWWA